MELGNDVLLNVRQYRLVNKHGEVLNLTSGNLRLFKRVNNNGYGEEIETERLGYTYATIKSEEKQIQLSGEIVCKDEATYDELIEFCQIGGLILAYRPRDIWRFLPISITISRQEAVQRNRIFARVDMLATGYWYEMLTERSSSGDADNGKIYPYTYPYKYRRGIANHFTVTCNLPSYFKISIFGLATNPQWSLIQNGDVIATGKITATIPSEHKLVVDTNPKRMQIAEYTTSDEFVRSLYGNSDFTTQRIFELPQGESTLVVTTSDITPPQVVLEVERHV